MYFSLFNWVDFSVYFIRSCLLLEYKCALISGSSCIYLIMLFVKQVFLVHYYTNTISVINVSDDKINKYVCMYVCIYLCIYLSILSIINFWISSYFFYYFSLFINLLLISIPLNISLLNLFPSLYLSIYLSECLSFCDFL